MVGLAWGLTTPFIRRAAKDHHPPRHALLDSDAVRRSRLKTRFYGGVFAVFDLLRNPRYAVPLLVNLTGSVWFFLLIGKAGMLLFLLSFLSDGRMITNHFCRAESDGADREYPCVFVYGDWGVVG